MPAYNSARFLPTALESTLSDRLGSFELLLIDDGSTDETSEVLDRYNDPRLKIFRQRHLGLVETLNRGLRIAIAPLIARLDADDVSHPERLIQQFRFLQAHPNVGLLGTAANQISEDGRFLVKHFVETDDHRIKWRLLFANQFSHSSVMFRRNLALDLGGYSSGDKHAEDYGLWVRIAKSAQVRNLSQPLVSLRNHPDSISQRHERAMSATHLRISKEQIGFFLEEATEQELSGLQIIGAGSMALPGSQNHAMFTRRVGRNGRRLVHAFSDYWAVPARSPFRAWALHGMAQHALIHAASWIALEGDRRSRLRRKIQAIPMIGTAWLMDRSMLLDRQARRTIGKMMLRNPQKDRVSDGVK